MQQLAGVHEEQRADELVHNVLLVNFFQDAGPDNGVQVGLHILERQVNVDVVVRLQHVAQTAQNPTRSSVVGSLAYLVLDMRCAALVPHDIFVVVHFLQEHDLPKRALSISCILESIENLFQGYCFPAVITAV